MTRNQELQKLISEQEKDRGSVVFSENFKDSASNPFLYKTVEEILSLTDSVGLSDIEVLCFMMVCIMRWKKYHLSMVLKCMGRSHISINKYLKSLSKKLIVLFEKDKSKDAGPKEKISVSEEIEEIFLELIKQDRYFD